MIAANHLKNFTGDTQNMNESKIRLVRLHSHSLLILSADALCLASSQLFPVKMTLLMIQRVGLRSHLLSSALTTVVVSVGWPGVAVLGLVDLGITPRVQWLQSIGRRLFKMMLWAHSTLGIIWPCSNRSLIKCVTSLMMRSNKLSVGYFVGRKTSSSEPPRWCHHLLRWRCRSVLC
jgi:hypothetical protein